MREISLRGRCVLLRKVPLAAAVAMLAVGSEARAAGPQQPTLVSAPVLDVRGDGVQIYTCGQTGTEWQWRLTAPDAKLTGQAGEVVGHHFAGPTWRLNDGSEITGKLQTSMPHRGAIPWLTLIVVANNGKGKLAGVTTVQRTETSGGLVPAGGCDANHAGQEARVPYTARYTFYSSQK